MNFYSGANGLQSAVYPLYQYEDRGIRADTSRAGDREPGSGGEVIAGYLRFDYRGADPGRQYLLLVDADTFFQLAVYFPVDGVHQFYGGLHGLFVALCGAGGDGTVVRHAYFIKFLQVGRIDGNKVNPFI